MTATQPARPDRALESLTRLERAWLKRRERDTLADSDGGGV